MKHIKTYEQNNFERREQSKLDEVGELLLRYDGGRPTTWFYINDAISDGLLEDHFQIEEDQIEDFVHDTYGEENFDRDMLVDLMIGDFEETLDKLFEWLIFNDLLNKKSSVEINGNDENDEEYEFSYFPQN